MSPRLVSGLKRLARFLLTRGGVLCLVLVLVFGIAVFIRANRNKVEPSYQNVPASAWLELASTNGQQMPDAAKAFYEMGPSGAMFLGRELLRKPSKIDEWMLAHHHAIPDSLKKMLLKPQHPAKEETILRLLQGARHHGTFAMPMLIEWLEAQPGALNFQLVAPISTFSIKSNFIHSYNTPGTRILVPHSLLVQTGPSNRFQAIGIPAGGTLTFQTQLTVTVPGLVTTNILVSTHYGANSIPYLAHELLRTLGDTDPRIVAQLLRPVANRRGYSSPPQFGTNLALAAHRAVPLLIQRTTAPDRDERLTALALLKLALPQSVTAKETFIQSLKDTDSLIFEFAMETLKPFTNDVERIVPLALAGVQRTRQMASATYVSRSTASFSTLKEFALHSPRVVAGFQDILSQNPTLPDAAIIQFVGENGTTNNVDLTLIGSFTNSTHTTVRAKAWNALGNLTGDRNALVMEQMTLLESGDIWRSYIKLGELGPAAWRAVPKVREGLQNKEERIVAKAAETLGKIGPAAQVALPELEKLRDHPHLMVREPVEEAIRQISTPPKANGSE